MMQTGYISAQRSFREGAVVSVCTPDGSYELPLRLEVANHSPDGFAWGYGGSGPAQLALAILCEVVGVERAKRLYQHFKHRVVARLPQDEGWALTHAEIIAHADEIEETCA